VCQGGEWTVVESCDCAVKVGDSRKPPYATTCKVMIGTPNAVVCSYRHRALPRPARSHARKRLRPPLGTFTEEA